jgi:hypothetical protein
MNVSETIRMRELFYSAVKGQQPFSRRKFSQNEHFELTRKLVAVIVQVKEMLIKGLKTVRKFILFIKVLLHTQYKKLQSP